MIRKATLDDLAMVRRLWCDWWIEAPVAFRTFGDLEAAQSDLFTAVVEGRVEGVALVEPRTAVLLWAGTPPELSGFGVYVTPSERRTSLGSRLVEEAKRLAREQGFRRIYVAPYCENKASQEWLTGLGFVPVQTVMLREI